MPAQMTALLIAFTTQMTVSLMAFFIIVRNFNILFLFKYKESDVLGDMTNLLCEMVPT